jgi:DNA polymerase III subunit delta'
MDWFYQNNPIAGEGIAGYLDKAFRADRVPSAYLFVGPEGTGKIELARRFAQMMNCREQRICHQCENCRLFDRDGHPDFIFVEPSGQFIRIGQIQELLRRLNLMPSRARKRVVLVKDANRMNTEAANSFLKILEEPPLNTLLILLTNDELLLLDTIRSRCQSLYFPPLTSDQLQAVLERDGRLSEAETAFVRCYAQGRLRWDFIQNAAKLMALRRQVFEMLGALTTERMIDYVDWIDQWIHQSQHPYVLEFCLTWIRDMINLKVGRVDLMINQDLRSEVEPSAIPFSEEQLHWCFDLVVETEKAIGANASKALALEALLLQLGQIKRGIIVV